MDHIYTCVVQLQALLSTEYEIILGHKGRAVTLRLSFDKEDYFHLMGLQYLKDLPNLKKSRVKVFEDIVAQRITSESIEKSDFYGRIENRIHWLSYLEDIFDNNDTIFQYNETLNGFSKIQAEFLLDYQCEPERIFVFLSKRKNGAYFCRSFFPMDTIDYTKNQQRWTLLKKVKRNLSTQETWELYRNPHYQE